MGAFTPTKTNRAVKSAPSAASAAAATTHKAKAAAKTPAPPSFIPPPPSPPSPPPPQPPRFLLDMDETARELHISKAGLFRLLQRGDGPSSIKVGRKRLFPIAAIERYIAERAAAGEGGAA